MARKKTIRIQGIKGKRHMKYPFFANESVKKEIIANKLFDKLKQAKNKGLILRINRGNGTTGSSGSGENVNL